MHTKKFTLENGMQVLLVERHSAKVVSFNALVKVGSANETDDEAGICHVIEHMLFKGTPARPAGTIAADVEAAGGEINAYTSIDQTVFYINMATHFSDKGLNILADAIRNSLFDAEELEREKEVILEEIRREQDNPSRMVGEHLFSTAFSKHTYGRPIIGFPKTVKSFTREKVTDFYRTWYSPRNIEFVAVGDFRAEEMIEKIRREFAGFAGHAPAATSQKEETKQTRPRFFVKEMNIQSAHLAMGFHIPNITHADVPSLDVLAHILGGAESSRLSQEVKEKGRLVHNIYAYSFTPKEPGLFIIGATMKDENARGAVEAIRKEIEKMKQTAATAEDIARAKLNIRSNEIYEKETAGGLAAKIVYFLATAGSHEFESLYYKNLADVDAAKVMEAARKYLTFDNCTLALLVPEKSKWAKAKGQIEKTVAPVKRSVSVKKSKQHSVQKFRLKNGIRVIVRPNHSLPVISVCAAALGGTRFETKATNGISGLWARSLTKGTKSRSAIAVAEDTEKLAGHIDGFAGRNSIGVQCEFLSEHMRDGFALIADILTNPSFLRKEVETERAIILRAIKDQEDDLSSLAFSEFLKQLYPKHPYGLKVIGTTESVKRLGPESVVRFHKNMLRAQNLVLSVAGDVRAEEIEKIANEMFREIPRGAAPKSGTIADPRPKNIREATIVKKGKHQSHIVLGFMGTTVRSEDRYAMTVLNNILAGQGGRLFRKLRDRMSLAYAVSSVNQEGIEPGFIAVYIGTEPGKTRLAIDGILGELKNVHANPVGKGELERSKQYLVGTYELGLQRNSSLASLYALNETCGIDIGEVARYPQKILAVSRDEVLETARRYIDPEAYTLAVVKPGIRGRL